jgi:hypothetical protein
MFTFLVTFLIEQLICENLRIITRAFIICVKKVKLEEPEVSYELTELPLPTDNRSYSFTE